MVGPAGRDGLGGSDVLSGGARLRRWTQLLAGLAGYGIAITLMIRSGLGLGPWDAFHVGLSLHAPLSIGVASIATGLLVLVVAMLLGMRPGPGTIANMVLIGVFVDLLLPMVPEARGLLWGLAYFLPAVALLGLCTGMYIAAQLGPGPRDGLMLAITRRTGWSVRVVRTAIELSALGAGWAMGGAVGIGTVIFALTVGPTAQWGLRLFGLVPSRPAGVARGRSPDDDRRVRPDRHAA